MASQSSVAPSHRDVIITAVCNSKSRASGVCRTSLGKACSTQSLPSPCTGIQRSHCKVCTVDSYRWSRLTTARRLLIPTFVELGCDSIRLGVSWRSHMLRCRSNGLLIESWLYPVPSYLLVHSCGTVAETRQAGWRGFSRMHVNLGRGLQITRLDGRDMPKRLLIL